MCFRLLRTLRNKLPIQRRVVSILDLRIYHKNQSPKRCWSGRDAASTWPPGCRVSSYAQTHTACPVASCYCYTQSDPPALSVSESSANQASLARPSRRYSLVRLDVGRPFTTGKTQVFCLFTPTFSRDFDECYALTV